MVIYLQNYNQSAACKLLDELLNNINNYFSKHALRKLATLITQLYFKAIFNNSKCNTNLIETNILQQLIEQLNQANLDWLPQLEGIQLLSDKPYLICQIINQLTDDIEKISNLAFFQQIIQFNTLIDSKLLTILIQIPKQYTKKLLGIIDQFMKQNTQHQPLTALFIDLKTVIINKSITQHTQQLSQDYAILKQYTGQVSALSLTTNQQSIEHLELQLLKTRFADPAYQPYWEDYIAYCRKINIKYHFSGLIEHFGVSNARPSKAELTSAPCILLSPIDTQINSQLNTFNQLIYAKEFKKMNQRYYQKTQLAYSALDKKNHLIIEKKLIFFKKQLTDHPENFTQTILEKLNKPALNPLINSLNLLRYCGDSAAIRTVDCTIEKLLLELVATKFSGTNHIIQKNIKKMMKHCCNTKQLESFMLLTDTKTANTLHCPPQWLGLCTKKIHQTIKQQPLYQHRQLTQYVTPLINTLKLIQYNANDLSTTQTYLTQLLHILARLIKAIKNSHPIIQQNNLLENTLTNMCQFFQKIQLTEENHHFIGYSHYSNSYRQPPIYSLT